MFKSTQHAEIRAQQRAIDMDVTSLIEHYGEDIPSVRGSVIRRIPSKTMKELRSELPKKQFKKLEKKNKAYMVIQGDKVITMGYQKSRFHH